MSFRITDDDFRALAEFRYQIRHFLAGGEEASRSVGVEPEQFQLLLAVRGMPSGSEPAIQALAKRLGVHHNTAVERIDRLAHMRLLRRRRSSRDARVVLVELTGRGNRILAKLTRKRMAQLRESGPGLINALADVISATRRIPSKRIRLLHGSRGNRKRHG